MHSTNMHSSCLKSNDTFMKDYYKEIPTEMKLNNCDYKAFKWAHMGPYHSEGIGPSSILCGKQQICALESSLAL